ncbi:MAG: hypothetical protein RBT71_14535 [Flavobacteriales bacterium]|nr:hypothetical protein [Flavobacteriales bacterium]
MKQLLLLPLLMAMAVLVPGRLQAQQTIYDETRVLYRTEVLGGFTLHGNGWGLFFRHGKHRTARDRRMLGIEVVGMKHPKEVKSFNPFYEDSRGYFYGKAHSMLILRPTYGRKHQITDKIRHTGVEINTVWAIGPSIGMAKPVYLQIGSPDTFPYESISTERYDPARHDVQNIYGRATWFRGVEEMRFHFGGFARFGFNFEHSGSASGIRGLEVGATIDAYPTPVPIMAELDDVRNKQFFFQFYLSLFFGKKSI